MNVSILLSTAEQGLIYSLVALGLYVSFRTLDIADLTTDARSRWASSRARR